MAPAKSPIVKRIDALLVSKGMTRKELLATVGTNRGAITNWDARGTVPAADVALKIADHLGVSIRWLLTGEDESGYNLDERNVVTKYRHLDEQGQYEIKLLLDAKLTVLEKKQASAG